MIISINGPAGSGKTTVAKKLAKKFGWKFYYMGGIRREKARERGLTLSEYNQLGESDPSTDFEVDEYQKQIAKSEDNFIIDSRTAWHFIPDSLKIYLDVNELEGARRVFADLEKNPVRNEDRGLKTVEDVLSSHRQRRESDDLRYLKYYSISVFKPENYDIAIDTSEMDPDQAFEAVYSAIMEKISF
jgi:CMP/dCMP kinase